MKSVGRRGEYVGNICADCSSVDDSGRVCAEMALFDFMMGRDLDHFRSRQSGPGRLDFYACVTIGSISLPMGTFLAFAAGFNS